ncbi:Membrane-associated sulfotransferase kil1, partial [Clarias magur]
MEQCSDPEVFFLWGFVANGIVKTGNYIERLCAVSDQRLIGELQQASGLYSCKNPQLSASARFLSREIGDSSATLQEDLTSDAHGECPSRL